MAEYLYAIQDSGGREVCSVKVDVKKVSEVTGHIEVGLASIKRGDETLISRRVAGEDTFSLVRVPADDKLADPVIKEIVPE